MEVSKNPLTSTHTLCELETFIPETGGRGQKSIHGHTAQPSGPAPCSAPTQAPSLPAMGVGVKLDLTKGRS